MKNQKLYFPVRVEAALEILRGKRQLHQVCATDDSHSVVGYTDRAVAVLESRQQAACDEKDEVCLVVCEISDEVFGELLMGDFVHFGPCAHWRTPHTLELEPAAHGRFAHEAHMSIEIISR